ncbi:MAG: DUF3899 domain-containing protein [Clostridia bacterium]|nr:DUF3899 domain-containing protein [Clostridia bacterium]
MKPPVWLRRLLPAIFGLIVAFFVARGRRAAGLPPAACLSDGFFVAGLPETGLGLLLAIAGTGFFDIFTYGAHSLLVLFTPFRRPEDLPDYVTWRILRSQRRQKQGHALLITGIVFLLLSALPILFGRA